jgi:hypothetical protein
MCQFLDECAYSAPKFQPHTSIASLDGSTEPTSLHDVQTTLGRVRDRFRDDLDRAINYEATLFHESQAMAYSAYDEQQAAHDTEYIPALQVGFYF